MNATQFRAGFFQKVFARCQWEDWAAILLIAVVSSIYFAGLSAVPFHPDESTQIFMSRDLELILHNARQLGWQADQEEDLRQKYRELDAPITRYLIGLGLHIRNLEPLPVDWNWSETWDENRIAGALPSTDLLSSARLSVAFLFPFTLGLIYASGKTIKNPATGLLAMVLLATHAVALLHTRRAMAESAVLFSVALLIFLVLQRTSPAWLLAIPAALAFNSKQSTAILILWAAVCIIIRPSTPPRKWKRRLLEIFVYFLVFSLLTFFLNPFLWNDPFHAATAAWNARQDLLQRQLEVFQAAIPEQTLTAPTSRLANLLANLYLTPPMIAEAGNYLSNTATAASAYLANPLNNLFRGLWSGAGFLSLTLVGWILLLKVRVSIQENKYQAWMLAAGGFFQFLSLLAAVTLPFQRYIIPLLPFVCLYIAFALAVSFQTIRKKTASA